MPSSATTIEVAEVFEPLFTSDILNYILPGGRVSGKSKTAPVLDVADIFKNLPDNGVLVVPEGADYSTWMSSENLGGKNWTIVYKND